LLSGATYTFFLGAPPLTAVQRRRKNIKNKVMTIRASDALRAMQHEEQELQKQLHRGVKEYET
jgi:hypothetical protein